MRKLNVGHIPIHSGYFWGLSALFSDRGTRLTSDPLSGSEGYCGSSEAKDYVANPIAYN